MEWVHFYGNLELGTWVSARCWILKVVGLITYLLWSLHTITVIIRESLKTVQSRQKSYVDVRRRELELEVSD